METKVYACVTNAFADEVTHLWEVYNIKCVPFGHVWNKFFLIQPDNRLTWEEYWTEGEENPMTGFSLSSERIGVILHCDGKPVRLANREQKIWPREKENYIGMETIPNEFMF